MSKIIDIRSEILTYSHDAAPITGSWSQATNDVYLTFPYHNSSPEADEEIKLQKLELRQRLGEFITSPLVRITLVRSKEGEQPNLANFQGEISGQLKPEDPVDANKEKQNRRRVWDFSDLPHKHVEVLRAWEALDNCAIESLAVLGLNNVIQIFNPYND